MTFASGQQLAQSRPANTSTATAFTASVRTEITAIVICNTTGSATTFSIYHDDDGTTYDQTTALVYAAALAANTTITIGAEGDGAGVLIKAGGSLGIQSGTSNACNFSIYGVTQS